MTDILAVGLTDKEALDSQGSNNAYEYKVIELLKLIEFNTRK